MPTLQDLANYIMQMEGYNITNSLAQRNNNPGNLRASSLAIGNNGGYAVFASAADGYTALINLLKSYQSQGLSLQQAVYKYAPPSENNSAMYVSFVANGLGVDPGVSLSGFGDSVGGEGGGSFVTPVSSELSSSLDFGGSGLDVGSGGSILSSLSNPFSVLSNLNDSIVNSGFTGGLDIPAMLAIIAVGGLVLYAVK